MLPVAKNRKLALRGMPDSYANFRYKVKIMTNLTIANSLVRHLDAL